MERKEKKLYFSQSLLISLDLKKSLDHKSDKLACHNFAVGSIFNIE
jgi:hypothetical protein